MELKFNDVKHQIDHIIAVKNGGEAPTENLAPACTICNNYEGSDLSSIDGDTGEIVPLSTRE